MLELQLKGKRNADGKIEVEIPYAVFNQVVKIIVDEAPNSAPLDEDVSSILPVNLSEEEIQNIRASVFGSHPDLPPGEVWKDEQRALEQQRFNEKLQG